MLCNGSCVASDATHCGSCSLACQSSEVCSNGTLHLELRRRPDAVRIGLRRHDHQRHELRRLRNQPAGRRSTAPAALRRQRDDRNRRDAGHRWSDRDRRVAGAGGSTATGGDGGLSGAGGSTATGGAPGTGGAPPAQSSVVTSASGAYWKSGTLTTVTSGTATVTVNDGSTAQTWEGFGGAFNEAGWNYLSMLSQSDRDNALQLLYGADGAHFNIGRVPIGANDYADQPLHRRRGPERQHRLQHDQLLAHAGREVSHPVHQGGAGGERQHPLLGQPLDAADLDEDQQRLATTERPAPSAAPPSTADA